MGSFVKWSTEIKDLVGLDALLSLSRQASDYVCAAGCGKPGKATREKSSVLVFMGEGLAVPTMQLAHGKCANPQIVMVGQTPTRLEDEPDDVSSVAVLWPDAAGPIPGLIIDHEPEISLVHRSGETADPWVQALVARDWVLVTEPLQDCPLLPDWVIEVDSRGSGKVADTAGLILLDTLPNPTPEWVQAATQRGAVRTYAGDIRLGLNNPRDAVLGAIAAGRVAAAYIPVSPT
ncbi:hypothetical protein [Mycobacterium avium]|uniref:hypothetical protein n=1 Tax=Mycobacterium avium TaxID=1764 RepID=UPI000BAF766A|nr:hypothetical protein [Mycobacterium avium]PBA68876.1 hypothetical protein CKJ76_26005 [Mycobacterium avium]